MSVCDPSSSSRAGAAAARPERGQWGGPARGFVSPGSAGGFPGRPRGGSLRSDPARGSCCEDPGSESPARGPFWRQSTLGLGQPAPVPAGPEQAAAAPARFSSKIVDYNRIKDFPGGWAGCDPRAVPARSSVPPGPRSLPSRTTGGAAAPTAPAPHAPRRAGLREELLHGGCALWAWKDEIWCFTGMEEDESAPQGVLLRGPGACR